MFVVDFICYILLSSHSARIASVKTIFGTEILFLDISKCCCCKHVVKAPRNCDHIVRGTRIPPLCFCGQPFAKTDRFFWIEEVRIDFTLLLFTTSVCGSCFNSEVFSEPQNLRKSHLFCAFDDESLISSKDARVTRY